MAILVVFLALTANDDDLRELKIPPNAAARVYSTLPRRGIKKHLEYTVGDDIVGERLFYADGQVADERLYRNKKVSEERRLVPNRMYGEKLHGIWRQYWPNGKLFAERPFRDGQMDGTFRFWDENGKLIRESVMKKGTGLLCEAECPILQSEDVETNYVDGKREGPKTLWGKFEGCTGLGYSISTYKNDEREGWGITRDEDGTLIAYAHSKAGKLHGVMRHFDHEGNPLPKYPRYFINGEEVDEPRFLDAARADKLLKETLTYAPPRTEKPPPRQKLATENAEKR